MGSRISQPVDEVERVRRRVVAELAQSGAADVSGHPPRPPSALLRARRSVVQAWVLAGLHRGVDR